MRWIAAALLLALAMPARADDPAAPAPAPALTPAPPPPTPFDRGRFGLGGGAGEQTNFDKQYIWIGASVGYFVLDGVELGLSGLYEFGNDPTITEVSPSLRYVAQPLVGKWPVVPYIGGFYSRWFVGSGGDTVGARAGVILISGQLLLGLGAVYEHQVESPCASGCDSVYPDVTIGVAL